MVTVGGNDELVTMHLGKDPTKEAYDFLVSFYDTNVGGVGPRNFVSRIHHFVDLVQTRLQSRDPLLLDCALGPFRDVKETLAAGEDPSVVLSWLQTVLQVMRPWHINAVGNDSLGVFVHGFMESTDDQMNARLGRKVDSPWALRGFVDYVGEPIIVRYGPDRDTDTCLVVASFDPGVYAHDLSFAGFRFELNELSIAVNAITTAVIRHLILTTNQVKTYQLLTQVRATVLQHMDSTGIRTRLTELRQMIQQQSQAVLTGRQLGRVERTGNWQVAFAYSPLRMQGTPTTAHGQADQTRVEQVGNLIRMARRLQEEGYFVSRSAVLTVIPVPENAWNAATRSVDFDVTEQFLLRVPDGVNPFTQHRFGQSVPGRTSERRAAGRQRAAPLVKTDLEKIVETVGKLDYLLKLRKATAYQIAVCPTCNATFVCGKDNNYPSIPHYHASKRVTLLSREWVAFLHDFLRYGHDYSNELRSTMVPVKWVRIDVLIPDWWMSQSELPEFLKAAWRTVLLRKACIPILESVYEQLDASEPQLDDEDDEKCRAFESGEEESDEEEDKIKLQAREYGIFVGLDYLLGVDKASSLSMGQLRNIEEMDQRARTNAVKSLHLENRQDVLRWMVCARSPPCNIARLCRSGTVQHTCPTTRTKIRSKDQLEHLQSFGEMPAVLKKSIFRNLLFMQSELRQNLAAVGIVASNVFWWQLQSQDDRVAIPSEIRDRTPIPLTQVEWVIPQRGPGPDRSAIRAEVRTLRDNLRAAQRSRTTITHATSDFFARRGIPWDERKTILAVVHAREREELGESQLESQLTPPEMKPQSQDSQNILPSQAQALDDNVFELSDEEEEEARDPQEGSSSSRKRPRV
ncbi:hypothetical protein DFS34DRAFT_202965 [Phlyctochytrium arcticum]|nr:hypothetical protein DFS34DRAFT_202965 [Phlyctochytrium arcticum]